jgi:hypothetical protein
MQASVVDLRYKMNDVLKALERNEDVEIMYRGKRKGVIRADARTSAAKVMKHPFFNMRPSGQTVEAELQALRGGRYSDL